MKKRFLVYVFFSCVIVVTLFLLITQSKNAVPKFESTTVERGEVANVVSVTGKLEPTTRISLAFPAGGRMTRLTVTEGDTVDENTLLAEIDSRVLSSTVKEAEARVRQEYTILEGVLAPVRSEERALKDSAVKNAEEALLRAEESARVTLSRVFVTVDDVIHEAADELFEGSGMRPGVTFTYGSTQYFIQADSATTLTLSEQRKEVETILQNLKVRSEDSSLDLESSLTATQRDLDTVQSFLTTLGGLVNRYISENASEQTVYESFQTSISSARVSVNSVKTEVSNVYTTYTNARASLTLALKDLELADAGASRESIATQEASLSSAKASMETAYKRLDEAVLRAPVYGVISKVYFEEGETVSPNEPVFELLTPEHYEIEVYIPEADIADVKLGDSATVTFDAYGKDEMFEAEVVSIALSETVRDGVPTYKTTLQLREEKREGVTLRPGMTADVDIVTALRKEVLYVPLRSLVREEGKVFVRIFNGREFEDRYVTTGLRGSGGTIEILSGLKEGEEVVIYIEEEKA